MKILKSNFKRVVACILALAVLISALTLSFGVVADSSDTFYEGVKDVPWNGQIATKFAGGNGTESNPYLIETPNQLAYLLKHDVETVDGASKNKYYKLTANIYLNDIYNANWKNDEPNSWLATASTARFKGHLDGDGYTIFGLYINSSENVGLFSYADVWFNDVSIKNLTISDSELATTGNYAGAFIGFAYSSINSNTLTFENCYVTDSVSISSPIGGGTTGGFIGYAQKNKNSIKNSASLATLKGKSMGGFTGGFGNANSSSAENSFAVCTTLGSINNKTNCYVISDIASIKGKAAKTAMPDLDWENVWKTGENAPVLKNTRPTFSAWDGTIAAKFSNGDGSKDNPYIITEASQLALMITSGDETKDKYYQLGKNIYLNDVSDENWKENNPRQWYSYVTEGKKYFQGNFDGNGKTVFGLYYKGTDNIVAVIPAVKGNVNISNLYVSDAYVESSGYALAAVAAFLGGGNISAQKCYIYDSVTVISTNTSKDNSAGGIFGYGTGTVTVKDSAVLANRSSTGNPSGSYTGAIVANSWSSKVTVENTFALGVFGKHPGTVKAISCYSSEADAAYNTNVCAKEKMIGFDAEVNMPSLDWAGVWDAVEGSYPVIGIPEAEPGKVWDGTVAERFSGGNGTAENPYVILTAEQLARMVVNNGGKEQHYVLGADILLNDVTADNWKTKQNLNSWYTYAGLNKVGFVGSLDGAGHTVHGLYFDGKGSSALFPCADNTTIKNLIIDNAYLKGNGSVAALISVGRNKLNVKQCYVKESVEIISNGANNSEGASGFIAYGSPTFTIESCAFLGKITSNTDIGAFAGFTWGGAAVRVVKDCFAVGVPFCGEKPFTAQNCYNTVDEVQNVTGTVTKLVSAELMKGTSAKENMPSLNWKGAWKVTDGYPECRFDGDLGTPGEVWLGGIARAYSGGKGTKEDPYLVATGEQLARMVTDAFSADKFYKITHDIKLNDTTAENWKENATQWIWSSNKFSGTVDGGCHTISGLYYNGDQSKVGLFSYAANATIKRIFISDTYIYSTGYGTGTLVGDANGGTVKIIECYATETVNVESTYSKSGDKGAGGFIGYGGATINVESSAYLGTVKAPDFAGAFLGNCWTAATVKNSFTSLDMKFCTKRAINTSSVNNYSVCGETQAGVVTVTAEQMKGLSAKQNMSNLDWLSTWKEVENGFPILNVGEYDGVPGEVWTGKIAEKFAGGKGTAQEPYLISTGEQLAYVLKNLADTVGKHYKVTHDIYLNDVSDPDWEKNNPKPWFWVSSARLGNFNGHIDGDGHVIYGLYLDLKQTTDIVYTGLFPTISDGTVIEKLGISQAHIKVTNDGISQQAYVGGLAGYVFFNLSDAEYAETGVKFPEISQCFGDKTVVLEGSYCGMIAGAPRPANIYDSYFIGKLIGERLGAIVGNSWTDYPGAEVTRCYSATDAADLLGNGRASVMNSSTTINYHDNYANSSSVSGMVDQMGLLMMRGNAAKKNMTALDFENVWYALPNGTPVLRIFGTTDKFSNTSDPEPIEVSFVSNGGTECENVYGNPEEPINLPTPTREGYKFGGWYVFRQLDVPFSIDTFPYFNQILYAKWISDGYVQDFENYPNSMYDMGRDYEYYLPGATDYDANYVRNGMAAMRRVGSSDAESDFLVFYEQLLTVGKKYKLTLYVATDSDNTTADLSLVHADYPDVFDSDSGVEKIETVNISNDGKWQKVEFTFIARTQWIALRTSGNASLYFDDIMVAALSDELYPIPEKEKIPVLNMDNDIQDDSDDFSDITDDQDDDYSYEEDDDEDDDDSEEIIIIKKRRKKKKNTSSNSNIGLLVAIIVGAVSVVGAIVIVTIILIKRRKKKKLS